MGFLEEESDPINFLSIDRIYSKLPAVNTPNLFYFFLKMGNNKSIYKREAYTILSLLGDFGGFTDALVLLVGTFTSFYSAKMFNAAIASELPYSHRGKQKFHQSNQWH